MARRIDETELLAWIEDELPTERRVALEQALAHDAVLLEWARGARRDRELLRRAGVAAPAGLVADAIAQAERSAVLGAQTAAGPPAVAGRISSARRFALAATILIALGGVATLPFVLRQSGFRGGAHPGPQQPIAMGRAESSDVAPQSALRAEPEASKLATAESTQRAAGAAPARVQPPEALTDTTAVVANADQAVGARRAKTEGVGVLIETEAASPPARADAAPPLSLADAARLASEGRLVIVVHTADAAAIERVLTSHPRKDTKEQAGGQPPRHALPPPLRKLAGSAPEAARTYQVTLAVDPIVLSDLRDALSRDAADVRFVDAGAPIAPGEPADGVGLWWVEPVSRWRPHGSVPVLVVPVDRGSPRNEKP